MSIILEKDKNFKRLTQLLKTGEDVMVSAPRPLRSFLLVGLFQALNKPFLVITPHLDEAEELTKELSSFLSDQKVSHFPALETFGFERISPNKELVGQRMRILHLLQGDVPIIVVASLKALLQKIAPAGAGIFNPIIIKRTRGDSLVGLSLLVERLALMGYERSYLVEAKGEFCVRGGIVDIFPATSDHPVRVEFVGDKIESIRLFSLASQRSITTFDEIVIYPCREIVLNEEAARRAITQLQKIYRVSPAKGLGEDLEKLSSFTYFEGMEKYLPFFFKNLGTLIDYFSPEGLVILNEPKELKDQDSFLSTQYAQYFKEELLSSLKNLPSTHQQLSLISLIPKISEPNAVKFEASAVEPLLGRFDRLEQLIRDLSLEKFTLAIMAESDGQAERLGNFFEERNIGVTSDFSARLPGQWRSGIVNLGVGYLTGGFIAPSLKLALLSTRDIFKKYARYRLKKQTADSSAILTNPLDLRWGDYVVHPDYGIGRYGGLLTKEVAGLIRDYVLIEYAKGDKLYVPFDQMNKVQKYLGADSRPPKISRLGGTGWSRIKKQVRKSVRKLAFDLLELYTYRAKTKGVSFSADTVWQREVEDAFPFEETPDQLKAISEVKQDLESYRPMDRLICGDVGYGKTEVALRAVFKAVMDGKQAAILAPTTILVQQHFYTFSDRLAAYPVNIEMLSRFRRPTEQKAVIQRLEDGQVDIVIGTHRLLQKDVRFRDLGLVVIDEEQRFGVSHKEHLRALRKAVNVLTLAATPIPRTLQMSLVGVRDLSIIDTPPEDRYPVLTYVGESTEELIKSAIRREMAREGQTFYVHNRVETIDQAAYRLGQLIPEARIAVAHGQMPEDELEKIMMAFLGKEFDVLVCTTIIESGLDIPSVNTLIVEQAERLGLGTLYQLRGRVGRSDRRAYAYFFLSPGKALNRAAYERLKTISEFTELGAGLRIALRDLEIRGAGNLLGPEQHGHLAAVGFELYSELLREAVDELKGMPVQELKEVKVDLPVNAFIPKEYLADEILRIEAYRLIASIDSLTKAIDVENELRDRYGEIPLAVSNLIDICRLRVLARQAGMEEIGREARWLRLKFRDSDKALEFGQSPVFLLAQQDQNFAHKTGQKILAICLSASKKEILPFLLKLIGDIIISDRGSEK